MQCRDVRELADSFLTEQLLVETNHDVVRHLETCAACRAEFDARRAVREKLRSAIARSAELAPRPAFASELADALRPAGTAMTRRSVLRSWWAVAASLIVAAGGGIFVRELRSRQRLAALARQAAGDHQNCAVRFNLAEQPIALEEAGRRFGAPYAALATFELPRADAPLEGVERHSCVYDGSRFGHIVFRYDGALASLLVTAGEPPDAPEIVTADGPGAIASLPAGQFVAFIVADLDRGRVMRLANAIAQPLARHLA